MTQSLPRLVRRDIDNALRAGERPIVVARRLGVAPTTVRVRRRRLGLPLLIAKSVSTEAIRSFFAASATKPTLREVADRLFQGNSRIAWKGCLRAGLAFARVHALPADYSRIIAFLDADRNATCADAAAALGVSRNAVHNAVTKRGVSSQLGLPARQARRNRCARWRETCCACGAVRAERRGNSAPDLCPSCSRRAQRNGRCSCGMPLVRLDRGGGRTEPRCPRCPEIAGSAVHTEQQQGPR